MRFVEADFTRDPVAVRLIAAGLDPGQVSLFLLEGVAVYLELTVIERVLRQFRQVAWPGSRLAVSVSRSGTSPIRMTRGAWRRAARKARLKFAVSLCSSR